MGGRDERACAHSRRPPHVGGGKHSSAAHPPLPHFLGRLRMCEFLVTFAATYLTTIVLLRLTDALDAVIERICGKNGD